MRPNDCGTTEQLFKLNGKEINFSWSYKQIDLPFKFIQYIECTLTGNGETSRGYGESFLLSTSMKKAFSESWERFWMKNGKNIFPEIFPFSSNSNGYAAHPDLHSAAMNSRLEVIERSEILASWQIPGIWKRKDDFLTRSINTFVKRILGHKWNLEFYSISSFSEYQTIAGILMHPVEGTFFDSVCAATTRPISLTIIGAYLKLARSLIRTTPFYSKELPSIDELPEIGSPIDHLKFYKNSAHFPAFETHRKTTGSGKGLLENLDRLKTTTVLDVEGFPVLCYSHHPQWPSLNWGKSSIREGTHWPHPIG